MRAWPAAEGRRAAVTRAWPSVEGRGTAVTRGVSVGCARGTRGEPAWPRDAAVTTGFLGGGLVIVGVVVRCDVSVEIGGG
jgi:hypothetical protein